MTEISPALAPDASAILSHLRFVSRGEDSCILQFIDSVGDGGSYAARYQLNDAKLARDICDKNRKKWNVYVLTGKAVASWSGPNPPRLNEIAFCPCLYDDVDFRTDEIAEHGRARVTREMDKLVSDGVLPQPTLTVFTGGGIQHYWFLEEPLSPEEAEPRNKFIAAQVCGDAVHNRNRVLRVAGTINWPTATKIKRGRVPVLSEVTDAVMSRVYGAECFKTFAASAAAVTVTEATPRTPSSSSVKVRNDSVNIDWSKVNADAFKTADDLDGHDLAPHAVMSLMEGGDLKALAERHMTVIQYEPQKPYGSHSDLSFAIANALKESSFTTEERASILLSKHYPGNKHIHGRKDKRRAVTRLLQRAGFEKAVAVLEAKTGVKFPDGYDKEMRPLASYGNVRAAILALEIECQFDTFNDKATVEGHAIGDVSGEFADHIVSAVRHVIYTRFQFYPTAEYVREALIILCRAHSFNSVVEEIDSLVWDGVPRIDRLLIDYLGAADTAFNRIIAHKMMVALVRRARSPGCKFDHTLVLEGPEDIGKSLFCKTLAGSEHRHSDAKILAVDGQKQQELLQGKWVYELAELDGMKKAGVDTVKAFLTVTHDQGRPAYGRISISRPRSCIFIGSTNEARYLRSTTGNRRFWPVRVTTYNHDAFLRDREQLIAEAAHHEAAGEVLYLPADMKAVAVEVQRSRLLEDGWIDLLSGIAGTTGKRNDNVENVFTTTLLERLKLPASQATADEMARLAAAMHTLGWDGPKQVRIGERTTKGYSRIKAVTPKQLELDT